MTETISTPTAPPADTDAVITAAIDALDLETKIKLLTGSAMFALHGEDRAGLKSMNFSDGPTGVRGSEFTGGREVALLPNATLVAQTWDPRIAEQVGEILADEARAQDVQVVLGPTVNLHRSPLGGRLFEAYSEDPFLTGRLATAYVQGMQRSGVGACLKHYIANESETDRHDVNSVVSDQALREVYLLPFEMAVSDAQPWTVMAAYNDVNGVPATEQDELINGVLKSEWDWDGLVMSDWFATKSAGPAAAGGLDLVMPGPDGPWGQKLVDAVLKGEVAESVIDDHLRRLLRLAGRVGALSGVPGESSAPTTPPLSPTDPERRNSLQTLASRGITLLTGQRAVPIDPATLTATDPLVVIGRSAIDTMLQGGGSASVRPPHQITIADGLVAALGSDRTKIIDGVSVRTRPLSADVTRVREPETGAAGIRITSLDATGVEQASTVSEVAQIMVGMTTGPHEGAAGLQLAAQLADADGPTLIGVSGVGNWKISYGDQNFEVSLTAEDDSMESAFMYPPVWTTVVNPVEDATLTATVNVNPEGLTAAGLIVQPAPVADDVAIATAVAAAETARTAVVVVGLSSEQETEGRDKSTLALPGAQDALVHAVAAAAETTIVVVNSATPILMPWLEQVDAVVWAGLPGQEGGHAVADVLLGKAEPTGRLVTTFPAADDQGPAWTVTPTDGALAYTDETAIGYRGWDAGGDVPAFWFGEGLGWGTWTYEDASYSGDLAERVEVTITNSAERSSTEIVQVYWRPADAGPVRLVGWSVADAVGSGEQRRVEVDLDPRMFRRWSTDDSGWESPSGGTLLIARGLGDIRAEIARS